jgi:DNA-binding CsgD family transcriptional regulator
VARWWRLVGRAEELDFVAALRAEGSRGVLLSGEQGIGKTRLAREALAACDADGWTTESVAVSASAASVPLGAFAALLPRAAQDGATPLDLMQGGIATLLGGAPERRFALLVDDVHLLDDASAAFLHLVVTHAAAPFVILAARSGAPLPDAVSRLWHGGTIERLDLQSLSRGETTELLTTILGAPADGRTEHLIWRASAGNPLFVRELVMAARERGTVCRDGDRWQWVGVVPATPRLRDVVEARLAALAPAARELLDTLAVAGPLEIELVQRLCAPEALDECERAGQVAVVTSRRRAMVALGHPIYAELLAVGVPALRARAIRRQLADALEALGARRRSDLIRLATWRLGAGEAADRTLLLDAARRSYFGFFEDLAGELAGRRVESIAPRVELTVTRPDEMELATRLATLALETEDDVGAACALARALVWQQRLAEADVLLRRIEATPHAAHELDVLEARAHHLFWGNGLVDEACAVLARVESDRLTRFRAGIALQAGRAADALTLAEPLVARAETVIDSARAAGTSAGALVVMGRAAAGVALVDQYLPIALAHAAEDPLMVGDLVLARFYGLRIEGDLDGATDIAQLAYDVAAEQDSLDGTALFGGTLGMIALDRGLVATAARRLRETYAMFEERDPLNLRRWCLALLASATALLGAVEEARTAIAAADVLRVGPRFYDTDVEIGRAWTLAAAGDFGAARAVALAAARAAADGGLLPAAMWAIHVVARLGGAVDDAPLDALRTGITGELVGAITGHAAAVRAADAEALELAASRFETLGLLLSAADAWTAAAQCHDRAGRGGLRVAAEQHATELELRCEGGVTPRPGAAAGRTSLTARERQVADLAARGLSSAAIADELVLSVRTVESHLYRAYAKLGVNQRADLAAVLGSDGAPATR